MAVPVTRYSSPLAGPIGLMAIQTTEVNQKQMLDHRMMPMESNQYTKHLFVVKRYKIPGWPNVGAHWSTLEGINLAL